MIGIWIWLLGVRFYEVCRSLCMSGRRLGESGYVWNFSMPRRGLRIARVATKGGEDGEVLGAVLRSWRSSMKSEQCG